MTTIVVNEGLHIANYSLIGELRASIHKPYGWYMLATLAVSKENDDLTMTVYTNCNYIDQGMFYFFDSFKDIETASEGKIKTNLKKYTNNGKSESSIDKGKIVFTGKDDEKMNVTVEYEREADETTQTLKGVITVHRDGNKRVVTLTNKDI